jgi:sec-independent protein translocase protein TatB
MFDIGAPELLVLAVLAVIVFGPDKLPVLARKAAKALRYVRQMAGSAQNQLRGELGPDFDDLDFRDLNPKAFVQKHLLSDVDPLVNDVKDELAGISSLGKTTVADATAAIDEAKSGVRTKVSTGHNLTGQTLTATVVPAAASPRISTPYDPDAT